MQDGANGYLTDIPYVRQFCSELSPSALRAVAALAGFAPPHAEDFAFCEIGAGTGDTLATLAASYPRARFLGVDVNREHAAVGEDLVRRGELEQTTRFLLGDFEDVLENEGPFDYVCAHGVLTWIAPEKRKALLRLAASKLRPGGLLYLGYNALPGWAAVEPLRRLLRDASAALEGETLDRVRHAVSVAKVLSEAGAQYFEGNPAAKEMLGNVVGMGSSYAAHEFFHEHWQPMYFVDVANEAGSHDLRFVGQLPHHLNYRDLAIPPGLKAVFGDIGDRVTFEHLKAFATNEFFRRDVYVKGTPGRADETTRAYLEGTLFGTVSLESEIPRDVRFAHRSLSLQGPLFDILIARLSQEPATLRDLLKEPGLAAFGAEPLRAALLHLVIAQQATPMLAAIPLMPLYSTHPRVTVPAAFNRMALARTPTKQTVVLASPVAGTGIPVSLVQALSLRALSETADGDRTAFLRSFVHAHPLKLHVRDAVVDDKEAQLRVLAGGLDTFAKTKLPKLAQLGLVTCETSPSLP